MMKIVFQSCGVLGLCAMLAAGCASSGRAKESERIVESMKDVHDDLVKTKSRVDQTVASLDKLQSGRDLAQTFKSYTAAVSDLKSAGEGAGKRAEGMRARRKEYLAKWQTESETIQNPAIREGIEQRREKIKAEYEKLTDMANEAHAAYSPFLQNAQEVQTALSLDLSPSGVSAIGPAIQKTKSDGMTLSSKLDALANEFASLLGKMSPAGS